MNLFTIGLEEIERRLEEAARLYEPGHREAIIHGHQPLSEDKKTDFKRRTIRCLGLLRNRKKSYQQRHRPLFEQSV